MQRLSKHVSMPHQATLTTIFIRAMAFTLILRESQDDGQSEKRKELCLLINFLIRRSQCILQQPDNGHQTNTTRYRCDP